MRADEKPSTQRAVRPEDGQGVASESKASGAEAGPRMRADEKPSAQRAVRLRTDRGRRAS